MDRSFKARFISDWLPPLVVLVLLVGGAEFSAVFFQISERILPRPTVIFSSLVTFLKMQTGDYTSTVFNMFGGYFLAAPIGIALAALLAQSKISIKAFSPLIIVLATTPLMVLVPLLMIWLGWGLKVRIIAVTMQATPIILLNTLAGFTNITNEKNELAKVYGANRRDRFFKVVLPQAWPRIFTGLRLGVINATLGIIGTEFVIRDIGMGNRIMISCSFVNIPLVYGCILLVAFTSRFLMSVVTFIEHKVIAYR